MVQILTNLAALNQMLGILYEVASQIGLLPGEAAFTPKWITKYPGLGQNMQEEETPSSKIPALEDVSDDERERLICIKLAVLAGLPFPKVGDQYVVNSQDVMLYQSDKLTTVAYSLGHGKTTGPITHYGSYEETCGSEFSTALFIEFLGEVVDKETGVSRQIPVYAKVTQN